MASACLTSAHWKKFLARKQFLKSSRRGLFRKLQEGEEWILEAANLRLQIRIAREFSF